MVRGVESDNWSCSANAWSTSESTVGKLAPLWPDDVAMEGTSGLQQLAHPLQLMQLPTKASKAEFEKLNGL